MIREEEKLRVEIPAQIVVRYQLLYCLNYEFAARELRFMIGREPLNSERFYSRLDIAHCTVQPPVRR